MTTETEEDDFVDIIPARFAAKKLPDLLVRAVKLRSSVRVQFSFAPSVLEEIQGPRFDIAWSAKRQQFRITAKDLGRYEPAKVGRGERQFLRCPLPDGLHPNEETVDPEFYVDREMKIITIEMEEHFKPRPQAKPAPTAAQVSQHRDIVERAKAAVPSKIDRLSAADLDEKTIRVALGLNEPRPLEMDGQRFTKTEAAVVDLLATRERVTKQMVLMATADPIGPDEREEKLADVLVHKIRPRLEALGLKILTRWGDSWTLASTDRRRLKEMIAAARKEAA